MRARACPHLPMPVPPRRRQTHLDLSRRTGRRGWERSGLKILNAGVIERLRQFGRALKEAAKWRSARGEIGEGPADSNRRAGAPGYGPVRRGWGTTAMPNFSGRDARASSAFAHWRAATVAAAVLVLLTMGVGGRRADGQRRARPETRVLTVGTFDGKRGKFSPSRRRWTPL